MTDDSVLADYDAAINYYNVNFERLRKKFGGRKLLLLPVPNTDSEFDEHSSDSRDDLEGIAKRKGCKLPFIINVP